MPCDPTQAERHQTSQAERAKGICEVISCTAGAQNRRAIVPHFVPFQPRI
jgi:VanZ family protein